MSSHSRGTLCPGFAISFAPSLTEGAGKAGRRLRPQHRVQKRNDAHGFDRYSRDIPAFPAQWLYGLYVLSPVSGLFCHRRQLGLTSGLTPGSRRQDHTISPYATLLRPAADLDPFRKSSRYAWDCRVHRILCPTYRDDRETSLSGHETGQSILQIRILVNRIILLRRA